MLVEGVEKFVKLIAEPAPSVSGFIVDRSTGQAPYDFGPGGIRVAMRYPHTRPSIVAEQYLPKDGHFELFSQKKGPFKLEVIHMAKRKKWKDFSLPMEAPRSNVKVELEPTQ